MEMKFTKKDKRLLMILACVVILVFIGWYAIVPAMERADKLENDIEQAQPAQKEMEVQIAMYPSYLESLGQARQEAANATAEYYDLITAQEVDRELTNIVIGQGLECVDLYIEPLEYTQAEPYVRSQLARQEAQETVLQTEMTAQERQDAELTAAQNLENAPADTQTEAQVQEQIYTCRIRLTVEGRDNAYRNLIDLFVNTYPSIRVTGIRYQTGQARMVVLEDGSTEYQDGQEQLVLNMEMYMCDKRLYQQDAQTEGESESEGVSQ